MIGAIAFPDASAALQTLLAVSVLIGVVLVSRRHVARLFGAGAAYALWILPLVRLVMPPVHSPLSLMGTVRLPSSHGVNPAGADVTATAMADGTQVIGIHSAEPVAAIAAPHGISTTISDGGQSLSTLQEWLGGAAMPILIGVWLAGALLTLGLSFWRHRTFMQTVHREAVSVSPHLQMRAARISQSVGLRRMPLIASSFISSGPLVAGLIRPVVMVPAWFETDYDETQQSAALAHELMHVRRGDLWALQISEIFVACLWFNPLAHMARNAFRTDQESACDADVLRIGATTPHAYGATLIKAARPARQERLVFAASLPLAHALKERLRRMTHPVPSRNRRIAGFATVAAASVAALALSASVSANAGQLDSHQTMEIHNGTVFINGERIKDRQIVVLGDPFGEIIPDASFDAEIQELSAKIEEESAAFEKAMEGPMSEMPDMQMTAEFDAHMQEFDKVMSTFNVRVLDGGEVVQFVITEDGKERVMDEQEWEDWSEAFEARTEAMAAEFEAQAEAFEAAYEPKLEAMSAEFEARIEALAAELEAKIDVTYGPEFDARMEAMSQKFDAAVDECRTAELADGESRIIVKDGPEGHKIKIACVKGDRRTLASATVIARIKSSPELAEEDKASFLEQAGVDELDGTDD